MTHPVVLAAGRSAVLALPGSLASPPASGLVLVAAIVAAGLVVLAAVLGLAALIQRGRHRQAERAIHHEAHLLVHGVAAYHGDRLSLPPSPDARVVAQVETPRRNLAVAPASARTPPMSWMSEQSFTNFLADEPARFSDYDHERPTASPPPVAMLGEDTVMIAPPAGRYDRTTASPPPMAETEREMGSSARPSASQLLVDATDALEAPSPSVAPVESLVVPRDSSRALVSLYDGEDDDGTVVSDVDPLEMTRPGTDGEIAYAVRESVSDHTPSAPPVESGLRPPRSFEATDELRSLSALVRARIGTGT